jgi:type IV pilus assembly protein PilZ
MEAKEIQGAIQLKIKFKDVESFIDEYTYNISKGGVFIRTANPCRLRDIVEIVLILPEEQLEVIVKGEVVQVVSSDMANEHLPAGMGIHILDFKKEDQERIERFVSSRLRQKTETPAIREDRRIEARLKVKFESKDKLAEEYANNISHGGIFISTNDLKQAGEKIEIILIHPDNEQELLLKGEVVHVVSEDDTKKFNIPMGMGIKFTEMDSYDKYQVDEFIKSETIRNAGKDLIVEESNYPEEVK